MKPLTLPRGETSLVLQRDLLSQELDPLALYASGIDTSDYVARLAPLIHGLVPDPGDLVDIGAGGGQLGAALVAPGRRWTAIEPSPVMQAWLRALREPPEIVPSGWDVPGLRIEPSDTVLAATMPGYFGDPAAFLAFCRGLARRTVIWVVPAQRGPRGLVLAGCLPAAWHGEDETPAIDLVLPQLRGDLPFAMAETDWTFSLVTRDLPRLGRYLADRLGWLPDDPRRADLVSHLIAQATSVPGGLCLSVHRRSAILVWKLS